MKNILIKNKTLILSSIVLTIGLFSIMPIHTFAQDSYTFLQPLPGIESTLATENILSVYLSNLFKILISLSIMLAIGMIVLGGLQYLGGEAAKTKGAGISRINGAIFGLALALFAWLFLNTINPALTEFSLNITTEDVNNISGVPDAPGWFYAKFNPDTKSNEWIGSGTPTSTVVYDYSRCPGGVKPPSEANDCERSRTVNQYTRGFYSLGLCEKASEKAKGSATCVPGNNENGAWYFAIAPGVLGKTESVGLFPDKETCEREYAIMEGTSGVSMRGNCTVDLSRATSETVFSGFADGWWFGSYTRFYSEALPHGKYDTAEQCADVKKGYSQSTDCVFIEGEKMTGATATTDEDGRNADFVASLPEECDGCIEIDPRVPLKPGIAGNQVHGEIAGQLISLTNSLASATAKDAHYGGGSIDWYVTEIYKPSFKHASACHHDGRCFDANFTGADRTTVEVALAEGNINRALNILEDFIEAAQSNGFTAYYEVTSSSQKILLRNKTTLNPSLFRHIPGITANHFHIIDNN